MYKLIHSSLLLTLLLLGCTKEKSKSPMDGSYKGVMIWTITTDVDGVPHENADTFGLQFNIDGSTFFDGKCEGDFSMPAVDSVLFASEDCGCMCDCQQTPGDCAGHFALGKHTFTLEGDSLKMWHAFHVSSPVPSLGITLEFDHEYQYLLRKE
jgi:hypothetical protein